MKMILPLLALILSAAVQAQTSTWATLIKIGDKLHLDKREIALVVSVSAPVYLVIEQPQQSSKGVRLHPPENRRSFYYQSIPTNYVNVRSQSTSWNRPFPIAGPCSIRLGTSAAMTVRVISPDQS